MAWDWIAPVVTGVVGVTGIAATYLGTSSQRRAQIEAQHSEQAHSDHVRRTAEKQEAFIRFLDAFDEVAACSHDLRAAWHEHPQRRVESCQLAVDAANKRLQVGRNRLALFADLYLLFYLDQLMADSSGLRLAAATGNEYQQHYPHAIHRCYLLMQYEVAGQDTRQLDPQKVLDLIAGHEARSNTVLGALIQSQDPSQ